MLSMFGGKSGAASSDWLASSPVSSMPSLPVVPTSWSDQPDEKQAENDDVTPGQPHPEDGPSGSDSPLQEISDDEVASLTGDAKKVPEDTSSWMYYLFQELNNAKIDPAKFGENAEEAIGKAINRFAKQMPKTSGEINDGTMPSELEDMLHSAATEGKFDMRLKVGQLWARELKSDPELKKKYMAAGKNYEAQRAFRTAWSAKTYQTKKEDRMKIVRQRTSDDTWGSYEPTAIVHEREGKDTAGAKATLNYVRKCLQLREKGYKYRNRPFIMWNSFTERYDFLYIKRGFRDSLEEIWSMSTVETVAGDAASASSAKDGSPAIPVKGGGNTKLMEKDQPTSGNRRKGDGAGGDDVPDPEAMKKKRAKKDLDMCIQKAKMAKTKMLAAQAGYTDLMRAIEAAPEWSWAASEALKNPATEARDALEAFKNSGKFWQDYALQPDWVVR
jgi:hypothetical protein